VIGDGDLRAKSVTQIVLAPEASNLRTATKEPSGAIWGVVPEASTGSESTGL
jgi:hypothetical protein